jgi:hypothetical protein
MVNLLKIRDQEMEVVAGFAFVGILAGLTYLSAGKLESVRIFVREGLAGLSRARMTQETPSVLPRDASMDVVLPEGALIEVNMVVQVPKAANAQQVQDWLRLRINNTGYVHSDNPLMQYDIQQWGFDNFTWNELRQIGKKERVLRSSEPGGNSYAVKHLRVAY